MDSNLKLHIQMKNRTWNYILPAAVDTVTLKNTLLEDVWRSFGPE